MNDCRFLFVIISNGVSCGRDKGLRLLFCLRFNMSMSFLFSILSVESHSHEIFVGKNVHQIHINCSLSFSQVLTIWIKSMSLNQFMSSSNCDYSLKWPLQLVQIHLCNPENLSHLSFHPFFWTTEPVAAVAAFEKLHSGRCTSISSEKCVLF